jgi:hypothetical protein
MHPSIRRLGLLGSLLLLAGCSSYQWDQPPTTLPTSVHLAPVINRSTAPQIRALLTDELRETFLRVGGWDLRSEDRASAIVEVTVVEYTRERAATSSADTERGISFDTRLVAEVRVLDGPDGSVLRDPFLVETTGTALEAPSLPDNERIALVSLCARLAGQIQDRLRNDW